MRMHDNTNPSLPTRRSTFTSGQETIRSSITFIRNAEIHQSLPPGTTPVGVTPIDAMVGQFFCVFAHAKGHATFDVLGIPVFGRGEDAADDFATNIMLRFGDQEARALITAAAYPYKKYVQGSQVTVEVAANQPIA